MSDAAIEPTTSVMSQADIDEAIGLIHVSTPLLLLSAAPLLLLMYVSYAMDLHLESKLVVGVVRTFVQLLTLGAILHPIFVWGVEKWWVVLLYTFFMVVLASIESSARSKYYYENMFWFVLVGFTIGITLVSLFTFYAIIRATPIWDPQYVIPIVGMLLGNIINGVSLSNNALLTNMVEQSREVELFLSFGASASEASSRLFRESVIVGTMPMLNTMRVIGLISIPGMMTGQILAGAAPLDAAKYQILIIMLIAMVSFGTIFLQVWMARRVAFDRTTEMLLASDRFHQRAGKLSFFGRIKQICEWLQSCLRLGKRRIRRSLGNGSITPGELTSLTEDAAKDYYVAPKGELEVRTIMSSGSSEEQPRVLELCGVGKSFEKRNSDGDVVETTTLFTDLSLAMQTGDVVAVSGPSGVGKSQLLRLIGCLSPPDAGSGLLLHGKRLKGVGLKSSITGLGDSTATVSSAQWRRQIRYVSQYKVDIPGTPTKFIHRVSSLRSWRSPTLLSSVSKQDEDVMPSYDDMLATTTQLVQRWGLDETCLEKEWKTLSGGEAQRVYVAIAIASRPSVLLLDESTSALDLDTKQRVEQTVAEFAADVGMCVIWISHDQDQLERLGSGANGNA